jgi:superfamily II DNA or RNA helicase
MLTLVCTPDQRLLLAGDVEPPVDKALMAAWAQSSAHGILWLATDGLGHSLEPGLAWLRQYAQHFLARLCQTRDLQGGEPPSDGYISEQLIALPMIHGAEYLRAETLLDLWQKLFNLVRQLAGDDLETWLRSHGDVWHLVGRVTFHLAENKRDSERPFAFLATFTEKVSTAGKLQHLPLARALQMYTGQKDQSALNALLEPVKLAAQRSSLVKTLLESRQLFQALAWTPSEAYQLVRELSLLRECGIICKVPDWWQSGRPSRPTVQVTLDAGKKSTLGVGAMLSFNIDVCMDGDPLTPEEIAKIKSATSGLVSLRGKWVELDNDQLGEVMNHWRKVQSLHANGGLTFHQGMRYLSGFSGGGAGPELTGFADTQISWGQVIAGKALASTLAQLRDPSEMEPPSTLKAQLRPYQKRGLAWLHFMQELGFGACLADDMGLGKTLQVIGLLLALKGKAQRPSLIVAPASLVGNWHAECRRFAPSLQLWIAHSSVASRSELAALESEPDTVLQGIDAVITTYQWISRSEAIQKHDWDIIVLDEAQAIKNPGSGQTKAVKKLKSRSRIALSGTPVENRAGDLWSLFDFINPGLLGSTTAFAETLKRLTRPDGGVNYAPLRQLVQPYILRRMKTDRSIISDLPDKTEVKALCPLTKRQATLYTRLVEELKKVLNDKELEPIQRNGMVLSFLIKFKQLCNHPSQWNGDGQFKPEDSGKFERLADICSQLVERQERVIVFTQFQEMCAPLAEHLATVFGRPGLVLHGGTAVKQRPKLVEQFQAPDGPPFFVISVKAGGTGLTLTAASHVIHFDRWWNPAVENQATDRAYRIGQKKNVLVHKFVVPGTIEERVDRLIDEKQALATELLGTGGAGAEKLLTDMTSDELLRFVALDVSAVAA